MMEKKKEINKKFGSKIEELFELIEKVENWEDYVSPKTAKIIKTLYETQSMNKTIELLGMKYTSIRAHLLRAIDRITERKTSYKRQGTSKQSQELFRLMDTIPNWEDYVTPHEAEIAKAYRKVKHFYKVGEMLGLAPGNIAGTLYGTTQKIGVIGKLKQALMQLQQEKNEENIDNKNEG